jgi:hypothetical protein
MIEYRVVASNSGGYNMVDERFPTEEEAMAFVRGECNEDWFIEIRPHMTNYDNVIL